MSTSAEKAALAALAKEETCASACARAMKCLFGQNWLLWEPQTLWLEIDHQGVDVPVGNRAQIMAARNLFIAGRFWYDAHAFAATCIAFNNEEPLHFGIEEAPIMYLNWTVYEANVLTREFEEEAIIPEMDREVIAYTAVQLAREGFVIAPEHLAYAEGELGKHLFGDLQQLQKTVREGWAAAPKAEKLLDAAFPETAAGVQLARLATTQVYFEKRRKEREQQLVPLTC